MMTVTELLKQLRALDVRIWVEEDRLRVNAPKGALSPALREQMTASKDEILAYLKQLQSADRRPPLRPTDAHGPLPLSFAQRRMWMLQELDKGTSDYNLAQAVRLRGELHLAALEAALNKVVQRHAILRTTYTKVNGMPFQAVGEIRPLPLPLTDLSHDLNREGQAQTLLTAEAAQVFDLEHNWPIRAHLLKMAAHDHILLITLHHIASDGASLAVFWGELARLYESYLPNGHPTGHAVRRDEVLPEMPLQYADYAAWEQEVVASNFLDDQLAYWKQQFAGELPELDLVTDFSRSASDSHRSAHLERPLTIELSHQLRHFCQQEGVTLYMAMLAVFQLLLHRYTGQEDIVVGSPISGRSQAELERMIGPFINTLALRTNLSGDPTFHELVQRVRDVSVAAFSNPDVPFEMLLEELEVARDANHTPLFQTFFNVLNFSRPAGGFGALAAEALLKPELDSYFDLTLYVDESEEQIELYLSYNAGLFTTARMEMVLAHYARLLTQVVEDPHQKLGQYSLLTDTEKEQLLVTWNDTAVPYPHEKCLHQLIEAQAERTPGKTAVIFQDQSITYQTLNQRAEQMAHELQKLGVGPDVIVGICLERSIDMMVSLLAVLKAGGAYLPLDPAYPLDRLSYMLADAQSPVLITESSLNLADQLTRDLASPLHVCLVDQHRHHDAYHLGNGLVGTAVSRTATSQNLAYVIYTSGSTGKPKGVQIPHQAVVNFLLSMQREPGLTAEDHLLSVTTLSFDIAVLELYLPLITGATVTLVPRTVAYDGHQLAQTIAHSGATVMQATPVTWRMLLDAGWAGEPELKILCGGEAMPPELARDLLPRCRELWNMYGPTETTVWSTTRQITSGTDPVTIGHPIANTQIYILDKNKQPVPIGVVGDLYIGGDGLARNYRHRPELTAEKFIDNPFRPGSRMYSTGDLARYLANGEVDFLGRSDFQIKIRGFRVELGEIESALVAHTAVREVVTIVREDRPGDKRLVAYLILHEGMDQPDQSALRDFVGGKLPAYMVPAAFVFLESFPKTPNRKVDRKALPAPDMAREDFGRSYVAPRNPVEVIVAQIVAQSLDLDSVGIWDNFFELGGHSLLVTRVIFRITELFRLELPLRRFFENPTVAGIAAYMTADESERMRIERTAQLLIKLSQLSDEEVAGMLASRGGVKA
jgi:amino acid adenylation domain-containing protein